MIGDKAKQYQGKGTDLDGLATQIQGYLESEGFTVQSSPSTSQGKLIQAKKGGFLRGVVDADRALSVVISGDPADFTVRFGIGKWLEHAVIAAAETLLISDLFLPIDVAESAWNIEIEDKLIAKVDGFVG